MDPWTAQSSTALTPCEQTWKLYHRFDLVMREEIRHQAGHRFRPAVGAALMNDLSVEIPDEQPFPGDEAAFGFWLQLLGMWYENHGVRPSNGEAVELARHFMFEYKRNEKCFFPNGR